MLRVTSINRSWGINDVGLLLFRVLVSLSLFEHHGWEKLSNFSGMAHHFPDPLHIGMRASLLYATFADGICSVLVALGLATRLASFFILINLSVVYFIVEHVLSAAPRIAAGPRPGMPGPPPGGHVELVFVYLVGYLLLTIVGGGAFSLDRKIGGRI